MTNMTVNFNKCRAMKKIITSILIAAAAFTACVQNNDEVIVKSDKVTFSATIDAPVSRTVLVEQGGKFHAEWTAGDHIELFEVTNNGGTTKKGNNTVVTLAEGGATASVEFTLEAKTADSYTYVVTHNNASMNGSGTYLAFTVPTLQTPSAMNTFDSLSDLIISKGVITTEQPTGAINFELSRVTAIAKVSVKNLSLAADDAVKSVSFTCAQNLAGKITKLMISDIEVGNDPLSQSVIDTSSNSVTVNLPEAQTADFSCYMCTWPATLAADEDYTVVITTEKDMYIKRGKLSSALALTSGNITAFTVNMAGIKGENQGDDDVIETPAYIEVAGIKWATGNLQYDIESTTEGFAAGWRIASAQYNYTYLGSTGDLTKLTDYNKTDYFNFGGIADPFSCAKTSAISMATSDPAFDFSAKMYTDQTCTTATTDFAAAQYGDIAYWASNGQYRMPSAADFNTLWTKASRTLATYTVGATTVKGMYFFNPAAGEDPTVDSSNTKVLTDEDLTVGLFMPLAGRGYDGTEYKIYKVGSQGVYRTSTVNHTSTADATNGVIYRLHSLTEGAYWHASFGATARYCIRPIYIAE